jgi:hypothetical protein
MLTLTGPAKAAALICAVSATTACDKLLEVDLPSAVTSDALDDPGTAALQVNSVMAAVECGYSSFAIDAAGMEDNFQMVSGVAGSYSQYGDTPGGGACDGGPYTQGWMNSLLAGRAQGYASYASILGWTVANKERLLATLALYNTVTLGLFGEHFCEYTIDVGPMMSPGEVLALAETWVDSVFAHAPAPIAITTTAGTVTTDIHQTASALRARIRYARGDLAGAASDAANVTDGHMAYILREDPEDRRNMVATHQGNVGGIQAAGFLQGPVRVKTATSAYGVSSLGSHPVTGAAWPDPVPFTGYIDLAIQTADGRAVDDSGNALTTAAAGTTADTRVVHAIGNTAGGNDNVERKYTALSSDIPLVNWREMRLIQAENAGPGAAGVDFVNEIRAADGLPLVAGTYRTLVEGDADRFDDLLIEERRRALWLEARFWSTKIIKNEKLWFPRRVGAWINANATYQLDGGVRLLMPNAEYQLNSNLGLEARGTGCPAGEAPIYN